MDNAYLTLCNVPTHTHHKLKKFLEILHQTVYNIKMKWETTGVHTEWRDARLSSEPQLDLTVKGVPCVPQPSLFGTAGRTIGHRTARQSWVL